MTKVQTSMVARSKIDDQLNGQVVRYLFLQIVAGETRYPAFAVQDDDHFHTVSRYVERNALRASLVKRIEDWRWSSLYRWYLGTAEEKALQSAWPLRRSAGWLEHVNLPQTDAELTALRRSAASIDTTIAAHRSRTKPGQPPPRKNWGRKLPTALTEDPEFKTTVPDTLSAP